VRPSKADIASFDWGLIKSCRRGSPGLFARASRTCLSLRCGTRWQTLLRPIIGSRQSLQTATGSDRARHAVRTRETEAEGGCVSRSPVSGIECRESGPMRGGPASVQSAPFGCQIAHIRTRCLSTWDACSPKATIASPCYQQSRRGRWTTYRRLPPPHQSSVSSQTGNRHSAAIFNLYILSWQRIVTLTSAVCCHQMEDREAAKSRAVCPRRSVVTTVERLRALTRPDSSFEARVRCFAGVVALVHR